MTKLRQIRGRYHQIRRKVEWIRGHHSPPRLVVGYADESKTRVAVRIISPGDDPSRAPLIEAWVEDTGEVQVGLYNWRLASKSPRSGIEFDDGDLAEHFTRSAFRGS